MYKPLYDPGRNEHVHDKQVAYENKNFKVIIETYDPDESFSATCSNSYNRYRMQNISCRVVLIKSDVNRVVKNIWISRYSTEKSPVKIFGLQLWTKSKTVLTNLETEIGKAVLELTTDADKKAGLIAESFDTVKYINESIQSLKLHEQRKGISS